MNYYCFQMLKSDGVGSVPMKRTHGTHSCPGAWEITAAFGKGNPGLEVTVSDGS